MTAQAASQRGAAKILRHLNAVQQAAVLHTDNPILILAGAGSGKTRVLTHKIAYLIDVLKVKPWTILAMTFTNKAANEMRERIFKLTRRASESVWMGTFHSIFARILRREAEYIGYKSSFSIYDTDDQVQIIKSLMDQLNVPQKQFSPKAIQSHISRAKNKMISPTEYESMAQDYFEQKAAIIYGPYQRRLREQNAMDFDDLLLYPIELFTAHPEVLQKYQERFQYILVDEYQDTNRAQYILIKLLSARHRNICVVGDDDQSIYKWRGADVSNILDFEKDFSDCRIFRLEQNYRSTKNILSAANSVVKHNRHRLEKTLWTEKVEGEKVTLLSSPTAYHESLTIVTKIQTELATHKRNFRDFAILYRTNAQSRILEDSLRNNAVSYVIVGGTRFYERKEVKDVLAYLRLVVNHWDTISAKRIINYPPRGIGQATVKKIDQFSMEKKISFFEALSQVHSIETLNETKMNRIYNFYKLIEKYQGLQDKLSVPELTRAFVDEIGILPLLKSEGTVESMSRYENVQELLTAITDFSKRNESPSLATFLEEVSLITDIDSWDDRSNGVTLMTLHAAKGLEFPVVFIAGLEEGLFPLSRNSFSVDELEEERRLFYVGATRAQEKLYLSWAGQRGFGEQTFRSTPSRFIKEIDEKFLTLDEQKSKSSASHRRKGKSRTFFEESEYEDDSASRFIDDVPTIQLFEVGMRVRHSLFGDGVIYDVHGYGENMKITVEFSVVGRKKLVVKYANLEILG